jgi:hypothetical protein
MPLFGFFQQNTAYQRGILSLSHEAVSTIKVVATTDSVSARNAAVAQISMVLVSP